MSHVASFLQKHKVGLTVLGIVTIVIFVVGWLYLRKKGEEEKH